MEATLTGVINCRRDQDNNGTNQPVYDNKYTTYVYLVMLTWYFLVASLFSINTSVCNISTVIYRQCSTSFSIVKA